ncbi:MAG: hypothetical protein ACLFMT_01730 [Halobacteriales archaeon]
MYIYSPDEIDRQRAHHQALIQGADDLDAKRVGNLGELAFEQFCREYLPVEMWEWKNEESIRRCNPDSYTGYDFEVFGYEIDVKTSRDVSAFQPEKVLENDADDDIVVMAWHRDREDALILLGWERVETLESKARTQELYSGEEPEKLAHLSARPMNEIQDLGPNTAHMNQKPQNPFRPGERVVKAEDEDPSVAVVVEVLPPEKEVNLYGNTMDGEAVSVAFPNMLDDGPGDWREIHPAKLASYCDDQEIKLYTYKHTNLEYADSPLVPGDYVIKPDYEDPDLARVVDVETNLGDAEAEIAFIKHLEDAVDDPRGLEPQRLESICEDAGVRTYSYSQRELSRQPQY